MSLIVGNWKMHGTLRESLQRAEAIARFLRDNAISGAEAVICPPSTLLHPLRTALNGTGVRLGGQDCHFEAEGARTGDVSAVMLKDAGCEYVIVGHSERRADHGESSALVCRKAKAALEAGLIPIVCVGESKAERDEGRAADVVEEQLAASLPPESGGRAVVAYEPVWSIGTGSIPRMEEIRSMHAHIISLIPGKVPVLYGGSVKPDNVRDILGLDEVHGVLVGGASLDAEAFCGILRAGANAERRFRESGNLV